MALQLSEIQIRDPFVLPLPESHEYLLFGSTDPNIWSGPATGFDCYRSPDLVNWEGPVPAFRPPPGFWSHEQYWAPEVHYYKGRYFITRAATSCLPPSRRPDISAAPRYFQQTTPRAHTCVSGTVLGPWVQEDEPLWGTDGGHGMIARTLGGQLFLTLHQPNNSPHERASFHHLKELEDTVVLGLPPGSMISSTKTSGRSAE